jgi:hypothetical protein
LGSKTLAAGWDSLPLTAIASSHLTFSLLAGASGLAAGLEGVQEHAFVFDRSPQPFDEHVVHPAAATVHQDAYARVRQRAGEGVAAELMGWTAPRAASNVPGWWLSKSILGEPSMGKSNEKLVSVTRIADSEEAAPQFLDDAAPRNGMMPPPDSEMIAPPITE